MLSRPRRNRNSASVRTLVQETSLSAGHFVLPLFVQDGDHDTPIASMPGCFRQSMASLVKTATTAYELGISAVALFPRLDDQLKTPRGEESLNANGLMQRTIRAVKKAVPQLTIITDVALDPYSSDGHDGLVLNGKIANDETLPLLAAMAVAQAQAGADMVAPSDMMDGRVGVIRAALDSAGFTQVGICSYCIKYASAFYGPFRDALDSAPRPGADRPRDKKTYQMDPANVREAFREIALDEAEGADWLMVKPGLPYLDVIRAIRPHTALPIAAYHVSGEFAMLKAAAQNGWLNYDDCLLESLLSFRRAGADIIFTYGAMDAARLLRVSGSPDVR
jgi:porphobilinogen synthase